VIETMHLMNVPQQVQVAVVAMMTTMATTVVLVQMVIVATMMAQTEAVMTTTTQLVEIVEMVVILTQAAITTLRAIMEVRLTIASFRKCLNKFGTTLITVRMKFLGLSIKLISNLTLLRLSFSNSKQLWMKKA